MVHPTRKNHHNQNSSYLHSQPHKHTHKKGIQAQAAGTHKQQTPQHNHHHKNSGSINVPWRMKKHLKKYIGTLLSSQTTPPQPPNRTTPCNQLP